MATPQLGQYVRMLDIDAGGKHSDWFYRVHWVLPQRLPSLIHVTYARLPVLHSSFFILPCRFDKIISLEFRISEEQSFREVVRILNRFTKLQKLVIKGYKAGSFFCRDLHDQEGLLSVDICGVSRYTPTSVDDVCHWLTKKLPPRSLNWLTLRLDNRYTSSRYVRELLVMHSETMKRLEITIGLFDLKKRPNDLGIEDMCSVLPSTNLEEFSITFEDKFAKPQVLALLVTSFLSSLPRSICRIALGHASWGKMLGSLPLVADSPIGRFWSAIDSTLANPIFSKLTHVELHFSNFSLRPFKQELVELQQGGIFQKLFQRSKIHDRGILWYSRSDFTLSVLAPTDPQNWVHQDCVFKSPFRF
ncbi:hypothetical protein NLI96_g9834 [Meripilus lineatus]|uniref:Uncharacterized protein n=1 Tax=Meripilus lineatus TaxID=2056292 RepID=A0AAD5UUR4_9APHY|nr:hypothetical protein NLI96_g9834 [Physisporinus lineatus]